MPLSAECLEIKKPVGQAQVSLDIEINLITAPRWVGVLSYLSPT